MGGTQEQFEAAQQYEKVSNELDEVKFLVDPFPNGKGVLFNMDKIYRDLCHEVSEYLAVNGIKHLNIPSGGRGGGGMDETLMDIFRSAWANKNIINFIVSMAFFVKAVYIRYINNKVQNLKPRISLHFWIEAGSNIYKLTKNDLDFLLKDRLVNLLLISNIIAENIINKYKYFCCDLSISGKLNSINYEVSFTVPHEQRSEHNKSRFLGRIQKIKIKKNYFCNYKLSKWYFIRRTDNYTMG